MKYLTDVNNLIFVWFLLCGVAPSLAGRLSRTAAEMKECLRLAAIEEEVGQSAVTCYCTADINDDGVADPTRPVCTTGPGDNTTTATVCSILMDACTKRADCCSSGVRTCRGGKCRQSALMGSLDRVGSLRHSVHDTPHDGHGGDRTGGRWPHLTKPPSDGGGGGRDRDLSDSSSGVHRRTVINEAEVEACLALAKLELQQAMALGNDLECRCSSPGGGPRPVCSVTGTNVTCGILQDACKVPADCCHSGGAAPVRTCRGGMCRRTGTAGLTDRAGGGSNLRNSIRDGTPPIHAPHDRTGGNDRTHLAPGSGGGGRVLRRAAPPSDE